MSQSPQGSASATPAISLPSLFFRLRRTFFKQFPLPLFPGFLTDFNALLLMALHPQLALLSSVRLEIFFSLSRSVKIDSVLSSSSS
jgi:hypothetical protein